MKAKDLKNSILQMAVEGKLVPQDPTDEPATVLLERIREEKHRLIAEGKAKFPKGGESVIYTASDGSPYEKRVDAKGRVLSDERIAGEVPFEELPEGWVWARLAGVASIQLGKMLDKQKNEGEPVPYLGNANVQWGEFDLANIKTMRMNEADRAKFALANGDLIVCEGGVPGRCAIWTSNKTMYYQKALHRVRCDKRLLLNTYCELYIRLIVQSHIWDGCFTGTTIKHLPAQTLSSWVLPVPPLAEQRRIVERVNELMPLVEEYGKLEDAREELDATLPGRLRKSVLQMAVQGKLVSQDPADEPASALLERIREQRRQLIAEKKMKAPKGGESVIFRGSDGRRYEKRIDAKGRESDPTCIEDEILFEIPDSWEWARLESIISLLSGTDLKPNQYNDRHEGIPYLTGASNFLDGSLIENRWTSEPTRVSRKGELLFTCKGTIGEMAVNTFDEAHIARQIMAIIPSDEDMLPYLIIFLKSMVEYVKSSAKGVIPGIERNALLSALIPVPPKSEQARISEKLASLSNLIS
ncbi:restriction endonuclease subunit S [Collinsella sp. CM84Y_54]|uniref:restriction endonuclease subunit S n=1 Tax=Collinsella sp. CM84Y_54 TaxID=3085309 RepID=UPI002E77DA38|nr:restriction endonuclease subunit S [Collinsella sp. CM84Y_54]